MLTKAEWATTLVSGAGVVGMTIMATLYWAGEGHQQPSSVVKENGEHVARQMYELSDAFFICRDQISRVVPYKVRNINIDSLSSRYEEMKNTNLVVIDLEVADQSGKIYSKSNYDAKVLCQVSAASNEVTSFRMTRG